MKLWSVAGALLIFLLGLPSILEAESRLKLVNTEVIYDGSRSLRVKESLCFERIKEPTEEEKKRVFSRPFLLYFPFPPRKESWFGRGKAIIPSEPQFTLDFHRLSVNGTLIHWTDYKDRAVHRIMANSRDVKALPTAEDKMYTYALAYDFLTIVKRTDNEDSFDIAATGKWAIEAQETLLTLQFPSRIAKSAISVEPVIYDYNRNDSSGSFKPEISYKEINSNGNKVFKLSLKTALPAYQTVLARVRVHRNS